MNRGIYATATGMLSSQKLMDVVANNLANASTAGFKRDDIAFNEALQREMRANGGLGPVLGTLGMGASEQGGFTVFEPGAIARTSNPLDAAIDGPRGAFAVQTANGVRYTRDGRFKTDTEGKLTTQEGDPVLGQDLQPIQLPEGVPSIAADGTITAGGKQAGQIGVFQGTFEKGPDGLFASDDAQAVTDATVLGQSLESSNVSAIESMIQMIKLGRAFEMSQKSIQQQDELTQRLIQSLQGQ